jgi:hypothetical protein
MVSNVGAKLRANGGTQTTGARRWWMPLALNLSDGLGPL